MYVCITKSSVTYPPESPIHQHLTADDGDSETLAKRTRIFHTNPYGSTNDLHSSKVYISYFVKYEVINIFALN